MLISGNYFFVADIEMLSMERQSLGTIGKMWINEIEKESTPSEKWESTKAGNNECFRVPLSNFLFSQQPTNQTTTTTTEEGPLGKDPLCAKGLPFMKSHFWNFCPLSIVCKLLYWAPAMCPFILPHWCGHPKCGPPNENDRDSRHRFLPSLKLKSWDIPPSPLIWKLCRQSGRTEGKIGEHVFGA